LVVTAEQGRVLREVVEPWCGGTFFGEIVAVDHDDGEHVLLTMNEAGVLHHSPDGVWEWVAVGDFGLRSDQVSDEPFGFDVRSTIPGDPWEGWPATVAAAFLVLAPLAVAIAIVPITRLARRHGRDPAFGIVACLFVALGLAAIGFVVYFITEGFDNPGGRALAAGVISGVAVATVGSLLAWYRRPRRPAGWQPPEAPRRAG
jgi:hypothetical protein